MVGYDVNALVFILSESLPDYPVFRLFVVA
eukprot:SAG31_NODE_1181_length_9513_cov_6.219035_8_plen_30_part_00